MDRRWLAINNSHKIVVGEAFLPQTDRRYGPIALYEHQVKTIESDKSVVVLDAPTGSGKTLAALSRVLERRTPAVFIYPTNALARDQVRSIKKLLESLGYFVNLVSSEWVPPESGDLRDERHVDLIHATGETLENLARGRAKGAILERILKGTDRAGWMRIVLTNPDTLYLVISGMYSRHGLISEQLFKFKAVVVDEFHLYAGPILARLVVMLNEMRGSNEKPLVDLLFLSATHGDTLDLLRDSYPYLDVITATPTIQEEGTCMKIRHMTNGEVRTQTKVLGDDRSVANVAEEIVRMYNAPYEWIDNTPNIKVLGIFCSVTFAACVAKKVKELIESRGLDSASIVKQIHGLIPHSMRTDIESMNEAILIGTSAIEVGIDFDAPFLVMEAHDLASFLQRFGRGGRHNSCEFLLYLPQPMADRLKRAEKWSFPNFIDQAEQAFKSMQSYAGFLCSKQMRRLLLSMALAGSKKIDFYRKKEWFDKESAIEYFKTLVKLNASVSIGNEDFMVNIGSIVDDRIELDIDKWSVKVMAENSFIRGSINNILICFPGHLIDSDRDYIYSEMDIFDIFRLKGGLEKAEDHWESIPSDLQRRYTIDSPIFIADSFKRCEYPRIALSNNAYARQTAAVFERNDATIKPSDQRMKEVINRLLEERNLIFFWRGMNRMIDYRIPRLYVEGENGAVVIGDWALVAEYIYRKQKEEWSNW